MHCHRNPFDKLSMSGCVSDSHWFALIPEEIKAIREEQHVSQPVFARYLNVSKNLVSDWERGQKRPGAPTARPCACSR